MTEKKPLNVDTSKKTFPLEHTRAIEFIFLLIVFLTAFSIRYPRIINLGLGLPCTSEADLCGDESYDIPIAYWAYRNFPTIPFAGGRPPFYHFLLAIVFKVLGYSIWNARIVTALLGSLTILYVYFLGKILQDWKVGGLASILLTFLPHHVYYSRITTLYVPMLFFGTAGFYHVVLGVRYRSRANTVLGSLLLALSIVTHDLALVIVVILPVWLVDTLRRSVGISRDAHNLAGCMRERLELVSLVVIPGLAWVYWQLWGMTRGPISAGRQTPLYYVTAHGGRAISMIFLKSFTEEFLGVFLSTLLTLLLITEVLKKYVGLLRSRSLDEKIKAERIMNSAIAYYAVLLLFLCLQISGVIRHHTYLFTLQFWMAASILLALAMKLVLSEEEPRLPSIWMLLSLGLYSFLSDKIVRRIFIVCSPLVLICASSIVSSLEGKSRMKKAISICLLMATLFSYIQLDLFAGWTKARSQLWNPLSDPE